jgi:hypothetical protein
VLPPPATTSQPPRTATATSGLPSPGPDDLGDPGSVRPEGWWDVPSTQLVPVLEDLLPDGTGLVEAETRIETGDPDDPWAPGTGGLHGVLETSGGPGTFQVILYGPDAQNRIRCRPYLDTCHPITDADGVRIGRVAADLERGTMYNDVAVLGPNGGVVYIAVMNATGEKPGYEPPSADRPPLTLGQLRDLAQNPAWTSYRP